MPSENNHIETLKFILENSLHPEVLDAHPWSKSLIALEANEDLSKEPTVAPGQRLISAIEKIFWQMMPVNPPRRGKRIDTQWGEFGLLAAQYFAPLRTGAMTPTSLKEAWGRIDQTILFFVFGEPISAISKKDIKTYKLVGDEPAAAPNSTLSDWHRNGLERLLNAIFAREAYLSRKQTLPAVLVFDEQPSPIDSSVTGLRPESMKKKRRRFVFVALVVSLLAILIALFFKVKNIYDLTVQVQQDAVEIQSLVTSSDSRSEQFKDFGPALLRLRSDFTKLKNETEPFLWLGPWLSGVPVYGGDLASVSDLVSLADSLLLAVDQCYQVSLPFLDTYESGDINPVILVGLLDEAQPQLIKTRQSLDQALIARSKLDVDQLSPFVRDLIVSDVDRILPLMETGLDVAVEIPRLMGASSEGPKTYLLLAQNEDELRPTGGFITAASTVLIKNGKMGNLKFVNSGDLDNWSKLYPVAPWQLRDYMNSPVLIFRDINWFANYPTAALYAEYLYSFSSDHSVDGVIAFDQHLLIEVLRVTGPIELDDAPYPIGADNIVEYMRESKIPDKEEIVSSTWDNKAFLNKISYALLEKILNGEIQWGVISPVLLQALNEHHLLLQVDNSVVTSFLAEYHWDGSIQSGEADFLMVVDSNVGFNKTNAVIETNIVYDVDLADPANPSALLNIFHKNNAKQSLVCKQWMKDQIAGERDYPITDCYWNYLRVYKPVGTTLVDSTPQLVPDLWMINKQKNPGQVDLLDEEIKNIQAFGTLQVVPAGESLSVSFRFGLPENVLQNENGLTVYLLKLQKQPGTVATPFTLRVHLPDGAIVEKVESTAIVDGSNILYKTDLRIDKEFEIVFSSP